MIFSQQEQFPCAIAVKTAGALASSYIRIAAKGGVQRGGWLSIHDAKQTYARDIDESNRQRARPCCRFDARRQVRNLPPPQSPSHSIILRCCVYPWSRIICMYYIRYRGVSQYPFPFLHLSIRYLVIVQYVLHPLRLSNVYQYPFFI